MTQGQNVGLPGATIFFIAIKQSSAQTLDPKIVGISIPIQDFHGRVRLSITSPDRRQIQMHVADWVLVMNDGQMYRGMLLMSVHMDMK